MCHVTNLDHKTDACKSTRHNTCRSTTFTWLELERALPNTKSRGFFRDSEQSVGTLYPEDVTVYRCNGHIASTNPIVRRFMLLA